MDLVQVVSYCFVIMVIMMIPLATSSASASFTWIEVSPNGSHSAPSARWGQCGLYHSYSHQLIIFGGVTNLEGSIAWQLNDVWGFDVDSRDWEELYANNSDFSEAPHARWAAGCIPTLDGFVLYGGTDYYGPENTTTDIWTFSVKEKKWTLKGSNNPLTQFGRMPLIGLPDDAAKTLLYADPTSSVWSINVNDLGGEWELLLNASSLPSNMRPTLTYLSNFAYAPPDGIFVTDYSPEGQGALWAFHMSTRKWTLQAPGGNNTTPGIRYNAAVARYENSTGTDGFYLFGGARLPSLPFLNDVWLWSISNHTWILILPEGQYSNVGRPMNREHMGEGAVNNGIMIFGGLCSDLQGNWTETNDVWFGKL